MCEISLPIKCVHCQSVKVVRNGRKANGQQNYRCKDCGVRCKDCGVQFQKEYFYNACNPAISELIKRMLLRGCGISDICAVLLVSATAVLRLIIRWGKAVKIKPSHKRYHKVQIDEMWSFVGAKQHKVWILYAYCSVRLL